MYTKSIILLILTGLIAGCGAGQSEQETAPSLSCDVLSLAASSAQPLDSVAVRGLPDEYGGLLYAEVRLPSDTATGYAFTGRTMDDGVRLQVPLHPGQTQPFHVEAPDVNMGGIVLPGSESGGEHYRWQTTGGSISTEGVFTAPEANGMATVTAVSRDNPDLRGEVEIRYGMQCNSHFSYTTGGDLILHREDQFYGLNGIPKSSGRCWLQLWFQPLAPVSADPDHAIHFRAVLPEGLREGSYPIGRNYTETIGPENVLGLHAGSADMKIEKAAPGIFFGSFEAPKKHGIDVYSETFLSEHGTLTVRTFDGKQLEATFTLQMIESDPEDILTELEAPRGKKPRRSITVEGRLIHTVHSGAIGTGGVIDNYRCAMPGSQPNR